MPKKMPHSPNHVRTTTIIRRQIIVETERVELFAVDDFPTGWAYMTPAEKYDWLKNKSEGLSTWKMGHLVDPPLEVEELSSSEICSEVDDEDR
ncbi:MAG: hypothetical protein EBX97_01730 [Actinobacteria bacterium]|nr:hypothetical protein [Actinomycetota bacterium]